MLLLATTLAARNVRGMKGRMTALPLWRPELSLESCPVEETEDSQAPSNHTTTGGADTKVANLLFPAHYNPPSLPLPLPSLPHHPPPLAQEPSSPGLNPPIKSYLLNLTRTNISFLPKISPLPAQKTKCTAQDWCLKPPCQFFAAEAKADVYLISAFSGNLLEARPTQSRDNSLDLFRPQSRTHLPTHYFTNSSCKTCPIPLRFSVGK